MPQVAERHSGSIIAAMCILLLLAAGFVPLLFFAFDHGGDITLDAYVWRVLRFTLVQASLSTLLSLALGTSAGLALAHANFTGRSALLALFSVPQALPAVVVIIAIAGLFGANGWFSDTVPLYGLSGILMVHVFFNAPLAARYVITTLEDIPPEQFRLAQHLGFSSGTLFRIIFWPALSNLLPRLAALIFLLCASSFATVLILGGPHATTLEVAIYQSLRLDFDVARALALSLLQVVLCTVFLWSAGKLAISNPVAGKRRTEPISQNTITFASVVMIALLVALVALPLVSLAMSGALHVKISASFYQATLTSFTLASFSTLLTLALGFPIALAQSRSPSSFWVMLSLAGMIFPPAVLATGWFLAFVSFSSIVTAAMMIIALNALMALPFATSILVSALRTHDAGTRELSAQLGLSGWSKMRIVDFPALRNPMAAAAITSFLLSLGDLTAVTLFGSHGLVTLPSLIVAQMGNFRSADALGTAMILAALCLMGAWIADRTMRTA